MTGFALPGIRLPFALSLEQAMVTDLSVRSAEDTELFGAGRISTALAFDGETQAMRQLDIEAPAFSLSLQGELTPSDHYPLSLSGGYSIKLQNLAPVSGQLDGMELKSVLVSLVKTICSGLTLLSKEAFSSIFCSSFSIA